MKVYKVVRIDDEGKMLSAVVDDPEAIAEYKPGEWTEPPKKYGPLCCFRDIKTAKKWKTRLEEACRQEIWECEIEEARRKALWKYLYCPLTKEWFKVTVCTADLPEGTVLADKVKLLKKVEVPNETKS